jgi:hypothetical protein
MMAKQMMNANPASSPTLVSRAILGNPPEDCAVISSMTQH